MAKKLGLTKKKNKLMQPKVHAALTILMALAYLPGDKIEAAYEYFKAEILRKFPEGDKLRKKWEKFLKYFERQWMRDPHNFSIFNLKHISNNFIERYHRFLNDYIDTHPNIGTFYSKSLLLFTLIC